ncbi:hypothetical protein JQ615_41790, partial [Bradyrhizobium jicamae]
MGRSFGGGKSSTSDSFSSDSNSLQGGFSQDFGFDGNAYIVTPVNGVANAAGGASGNAAVATSVAHSESVQSQPVRNSEPAQSAPA